MIFFPMICLIWKGLIGNEQFEKLGQWMDRGENDEDSYILVP